MNDLKIYILFGVIMTFLVVTISLSGYILSANYMTYSDYNDVKNRFNDLQTQISQRVVSGDNARLGTVYTTGDVLIHGDLQGVAVEERQLTLQNSNALVFGTDRIQLLDSAVTVGVPTLSIGFFRYTGSTIRFRIRLEGACVLNVHTTDRPDASLTDDSIPIFAMTLESTGIKVVEVDIIALEVAVDTMTLLRKYTIDGGVTFFETQSDISSNTRLLYLTANTYNSSTGITVHDFTQSSLYGKIN